MDKVGRGKERNANARFDAMCGHYLFKPEFCNNRFTRRDIAAQDMLRHSVRIDASNSSVRTARRPAQPASPFGLSAHDILCGFRPHRAEFRLRIGVVDLVLDLHGLEHPGHLFFSDLVHFVQLSGGMRQPT